jgi:hypothetical protein
LQVYFIVILKPKAEGSPDLRKSEKMRFFAGYRMTVWIFGTPLVVA